MLNTIITTRRRQERVSHRRANATRSRRKKQEQSDSDWCRVSVDRMPTHYPRYLLPLDGLQPRLSSLHVGIRSGKWEETHTIHFLFVTSLVSSHFPLDLRLSDAPFTVFGSHHKRDIDPTVRASRWRDRETVIYPLRSLSTSNLTPVTPRGAAEGRVT